MYPLVYKVGIAKGRSLIGVMPILAAGLVALLFTTTQEKIGSYQDIFQFVMNNGYYITAGVFVFVCILTVKRTANRPLPSGAVTEKEARGRTWWGRGSRSP